MANNSEHTSGFVLRSIVIGLGVVLFALLFFADKTQLSTKNKPSVGATTTENNQVSNKRPALSPDANTDKWIEKAKKTEGKDKLNALDSVIYYLSARHRYDVAWDYAVAKVGIDNSLTNKLQVGKIGLKAIEDLSFSGEDSVLRVQFVDKTTAYLEEVVAKDSTNEEALMALGTSYILSFRQENSMKGILSIRKVTEINPKNVAAQYKLGEFSMKTGQFDKAVERFRKVLALEPSHADAKLRLAIALQSLGKTEEALQLAVELEHGSPPSFGDSIVGAAGRIIHSIKK